MNKPQRFERFSYIRASLDRFVGSLVRRTDITYPVGRRFKDQSDDL